MDNVFPFESILCFDHGGWNFLDSAFCWEKYYCAISQNKIYFKYDCCCDFNYWTFLREPVFVLRSRLLRFDMLTKKERYIQLDNKPNLLERYKPVRDNYMTTFEELEDFADSFDGYMLDIITSKDVSTTWVECCEIAVSSAVELLNLSVYICENGMVPYFALNIISRLTELKYAILDRDLIGIPTLEYISEIIHLAGRGIVEQDERRWDLACKLFEREPYGMGYHAFKEVFINSRSEMDEMSAVSSVQVHFDTQALNILSLIAQTTSFITPSLIQRKGGVGYGRAAMIIEYLEGKKYIQTIDEAKKEGAQFRRILLTQAQIKELLNE